MLIARPMLEAALRNALSRSPSVALIGVRQVGKTTVARQLARVFDGTLLLGHPIVGPSCEGFVIEALIAAAGPASTPLFYRTADGAEIDLMFEQGGRPRLAIEVKRSSAPKVEAGFGIACDDLGIEHRFVVGSGQDSYRTRGNVTVHGLRSAMAAVREVLKSPFAPR